MQEANLANATGRASTTTLIPIKLKAQSTERASPSPDGDRPYEGQNEALNSTQRFSIQSSGSKKVIKIKKIRLPSNRKPLDSQDARLLSS